MTAYLRAFLTVLALVVSTMFVPAHGKAQTAFSVAADVGDFHLAVSNYYRVPQREVIAIRERHISDDDLPVVLFVAQRARVAPTQIIDMRLRGFSWWSISVHFSLGPDVYYVPVAVTPGPPYGRALGHYKRPRGQWRTIILSDPDVVNLVHLRFLSEHYHVAPARVIELRGRHNGFVDVHATVSGRRAGRGRDDNPRPKTGAGRGNGRGNR